jgi:ADP-ribose pyrophosphatase
MGLQDEAAELSCWETIKRKKLVDASPWLSLWVDEVRLPNGKIVSDFYTVEQPDHIVVFAVTQDRQVVCLWHYKHGPRKINLSFPAGYITDGESPLAAAQRELLEETGYEANVWKSLGAFTVDGNRGCGEAHYFLALEARAVAPPAHDDLEELRVELIDLREINTHLRESVATLDAAAAIGLALIALELA